MVVMGSDQKRCKDLGREARAAVKQLKSAIKVQVICDRAQSALHHVHGGVGLFVDGQKVAEGFIPNSQEIAEILQNRRR